MAPTDKLNNWTDTFFKLEYNLTIIFWFSLVGMFLILQANNSLQWLSLKQPDGEYIKQQTNSQGIIVGYSVILFSLFGFLIAKWSLLSKMNVDKGISIMNIFSSFANSLPIISIIVAVGWMTSLQVQHNDYLTSIDRDRLPGNFKIYSGSFLTILFISLFLLYNTIESLISKNLSQDKIRSKRIVNLGDNIDSILYLFIMIEYILLFIMQFILKDLITMG